jgi:ABC-type uncharacterized transport system involved in gliding motility auxiliary subunit
MDKKSRTRTRTDAVVLLVAITGIAIVLNALVAGTSVRLDLTRNRIHTLSEASTQAARALEDVTIIAYVSKELPDSIPTPAGNQPLKGIDRAFRDKIEEYVTASDGRLRVVWADLNTPNAGTVEEQAEAARLEPFSSTEAKVTGGRLAFEKYAVGATFHYKSVHEVFPKALEPGFFEFEITRRLMRLKEKHDSSKLMEDLLSSGKKIHEAVKACNEKLQAAAKVEEKAEESAGLSLKGTQNPGEKQLDKLRAASKDLDAACGSIGALVASEGGRLKGRNEFVDLLLGSAAQYSEFYKEFKDFLDPNNKEKAMLPAHLALGQYTNILDEQWKDVDQRHTNLSDSPGQRKVGFLCGHHEFCPFSSEEPLMRPEMAMMLQNNQMMKQIADGAKQIGDAIDQTNARIGEGLFTGRGFAIRQVASGKPFPADISALVVYAPRGKIEAFDRYQIDQFLLSGRPVVVFAQQWQLSLLNLSPPSDLGQDMRLDYSAMSRTDSNLPEVLEPYGVVLGNDVVLDSTHVETIRVTQYVNRGGLRFQTQQDFPYALIPVATDFDRTHALSRTVQSMALPWVTTVKAKEDVKKDKRFQVATIISSSADSLTRFGSVPVIPQALREVVLKEKSSGPHGLALVIGGPFKSAWAGKEPPEQPITGKDERSEDQKKADKELARRRFKAEGSGKLLVVASNLGIEGLSRDSVLEGFDAAKMSQFSVEALQNFQKWQANFQNWQIRIGQVSHLLQDNLRFLFNTLDWATAQEGLVDIRSKGDTRLPMQETEAGSAQQIRVAVLVGAPLLLILFGVARYQLRRRRAAALRA